MTTPDDLAARAALADAGGAPALAAPPPDPAAAEAIAKAEARAKETEAWAGAVVQFGTIARGMIPERARAAWTDENLGNLGAAISRLADHYGWKFGAAIAHPVLGVIVAALPLAWPIVEPYVAPLLGRPPPPPPPPADADKTPAP